MKTKTIRARVNPVLKQRLDRHIRQQTERGLNCNETNILVTAVVEYLDREEGNISAAAAAKHSGGETSRLNDDGKSGTIPVTYKISRK